MTEGEAKHDRIFPGVGLAALLLLGLVAASQPWWPSEASRLTDAAGSQNAGDGLKVADIAVLIGGLGGGLFGALVGGIIAWVLARQTQSSELKRDEDERRGRIADGLRVNAMRLMIKASLILSDIDGIERAIAESLSFANSAGLTDKELWQRVMPIVGRHSSFELDADELSPLLAAKASGLFEDTMNLVMQHQAMAAIVDLYSEKRRALGERDDQDFYKAMVWERGRIDPVFEIDRRSA